MAVNCAVGISVVNWKVTADSFCRNATRKREGTVQYLLCHCQALGGRRISTPEAAELKFGRIGSFLGNWRYFKKGTER